MLAIEFQFDYKYSNVSNVIELNKNHMQIINQTWVDRHIVIHGPFPPGANLVIHYLNKIIICKVK